MALFCLRRILRIPTLLPHSLRSLSIQTNSITEEPKLDETLPNPKSEQLFQDVFSRLSSISILHKNANKEKLVLHVRILDSIGCTADHMVKMYRFSPNLVYCSEDLLLRKLNFLRGLGITKRLGYIVRSQPSILSLSLDNLQSRVDYLKSLGMSSRNISVAIGNAPALICYSLQSKIPMLLDFFGTYGIDRAGVIHMITHSPSVVGLSLDTISRKITALEDLGFSREDSVAMARKYPFLLNCQVDGEGRLRHRVLFLLNTLKIAPEDIISFPSFLGFSFRNRLLFRYELMKQLGLDLNPKFYIKMTEAKFAKFLQITQTELRRMSKLFVQEGTISAHNITARNISMKEFPKGRKSRQKALSSDHSATKETTQVPKEPNPI